MKKSTLKHIVFSFALAGVLTFGMGTASKAATESGTGSSITTPAAKTDISKDSSIKIAWTDSSKEYLFDNKAVTPSVNVTQTITENGIKKTVTWTKDTDYTVTYANNDKASSKVDEATATITPAGEKAKSYSGSYILKFTIKQDISKAASAITATFKDKKETYTYTAPATTPEIQVEQESIVNGKKSSTAWTKNTDYTVSYLNNANVTTTAKPASAVITPKAGSEKAKLYGGSITLNFQITPCDINDSQMKMTDHYDKVYSGKAYKAGVKLVYTNKDTSKTTTLERTKDYKIGNYKNNINAGTATGIVTGIGNYTGTRTMTFSITKKDIKDLTFTPSLENVVYNYTGAYRTPAVSVIFKDAMNSVGTTQSYTLKKGTDYSVVYEDNKNVGTATVIFTGSGNFKGIHVENFTIRPKSTVLRKLIKGKKQFKAVWKKQTTKMTGYQLQYATNKKFTSSKKVTVKKKYTSKVIKKLKSKKTYYVRVRTYKNVDGIKYYSKWSNTMKIKTK